MVKFQLFSISKKYLFFSLIAMLCIMSCGSDDEVQDDGNSDTTCKGEASFVLDGETFSFENPEVAEFKYNESFDQHEFLLSWTNNGEILAFQILVDLDGAECFGDNQIVDLNSLPSDISLVSMQYGNLSHSINASNLIEDVSGVFEFDSCDGDNKTMSFSFEFTGSDFFGNNPKPITQGRAENVCYVFN